MDHVQLYHISNWCSNNFFRRASGNKTNWILIHVLLHQPPDQNTFFRFPIMSCWRIHNLFRELIWCLFPHRFNHKCLFFMCPWRRCFSVGFWSWGSGEPCCLYLGSRSLDSHVPGSNIFAEMESYLFPFDSLICMLLGISFTVWCTLLLVFIIVPAILGVSFGIRRLYMKSLLKLFEASILVSPPCKSTLLFFIMWSQTTNNWTWISCLKVWFISAYEVIWKSFWLLNARCYYVAQMTSALFVEGHKLQIHV